MARPAHEHGPPTATPSARKRRPPSRSPHVLARQLSTRVPAAPVGAPRSRIVDVPGIPQTHRGVSERDFGLVVIPSQLAASSARSSTRVVVLDGVLSLRVVFSPE